MKDFERVTNVIGYLDEHHGEQPGLGTLAEVAGLSPAHFQRLFSRWAGVSPKSFLQCLTARHGREKLQSGRSVLDTALDVGLSGPSRLHDLCIKVEAASPGEIKSGGAGWTLRAGLAESPFGRCLIAKSPRGICHLSFCGATNQEIAATQLEQDWPQAKIEWGHDYDALIQRVFRTESWSGAEPLRVIVRGTPFQLKVWRALLNIPAGNLTSYGQLANQVAASGAARAVGTAVGQNRLAYLIPCHRVIRQTGVIGDYRWGSTRKRAMIAWESARHHASLSDSTAGKS